jgi:hypothetical protein
MTSDALSLPSLGPQAASPSNPTNASLRPVPHCWPAERAPQVTRPQGRLGLPFAICAAAATHEVCYVQSALSNRERGSHAALRAAAARPPTVRLGDAVCGHRPGCRSPRP